MNINKAQLIKGWKNLGINKSRVVMVHSKLKSLGNVTGLAEKGLDAIGASRAVINSLSSTIGETGTLVFPTLSGTMNWVIQTNPEWSIDYPTQTSTMCEVFRGMSGVIRSVHPTHSVAAKGPLAGWITNGHLYAETPCGVDSPYEKLKNINAHILLIGVGLYQCTFMHHIEEVYDLAYITKDHYLDISIKNYGKVRITTQSGMERNFSLFEPILLNEGCMKEGKVGDARCLLITNLNQMAKIVGEKWKNEPNFGLIGPKWPPPSEWPKLREENNRPKI